MSHLQIFSNAASAFVSFLPKKNYLNLLKV